MKKRGIFFMLMLCAGFIKAQVQATALPSRDSAKAVPADSLVTVSQPVASKSQNAVNARLSRVDSLVRHAFSFMGNRYRRGGSSSKGFDCSGFTMTVFRHFNIRLPHTSAGQGLVGVEVSRNNIKKGDLILFRGRSRRSKRIGHVGIVISEKGQAVRFIHSSTSDGVRVDHLDDVYYKRRYMKTVRLPELYQ